MSKKRKWGLTIGVLALVGMGLWLRALASWRPVLVANTFFNVQEMRVSRDGRWLWTRDDELREEVRPLQPPAPKPADLEAEPNLTPAAKAFLAAHGMERFPRYWFDKSKNATLFVRGKGEDATELRAVLRKHGGSFGWSLERSEIYFDEGEQISIWNMRNGLLKRLVRYLNANDTLQTSNTAFSPDGKWLITLEFWEQNHTYLRRYDVQTGKMADMPTDQFGVDYVQLQFSPDGKWLLVDGVVYPASGDWRRVWGQISENDVVGWSQDNRVGIAKADRFEWRDAASGALLQQLSGPAKGTLMWTASPDGNWIYAGDSQKRIWRWRAR